jgi:hypothetical protein
MNIGFCKLLRTVPALLILAGGELLADAPIFAKGSQALVVAETPLIAGGKTVRLASAGEQFTVLATNAAQAQIFVSFPGADGKPVVASLALANVVPVDSGSPSGTPPPTVAPAPAAPIAAAPAATPPPPVVASPPQPGADGSYAALDVAKFFKADRAAANAHFTGKPLKVSGSIERAEVRVGSDAPVVTFATANGMPRIKLQVHPSVSRDSEFYRGARAASWYYDGWYYYGHRLEFRPAGNGLEARFKYKRTYSSGSGSSTYRAWSDWFAILTPGDILTGQGTCKGLMMDVIVEAAELSRPR